MQRARLQSARPTLPPRTSSPMIKHAAVWIVRVLRSSAVAILPAAARRPVSARDGESCRVT